MLTQVIVRKNAAPTFVGAVLFCFSALLDGINFRQIPLRRGPEQAQAQGPEAVPPRVPVLPQERAPLWVRPLPLNSGSVPERGWILYSSARPLSDFDCVRQRRIF